MMDRTSRIYNLEDDCENNLCMRTKQVKSRRKAQAILNDALSSSSVFNVSHPSEKGGNLFNEANFDDFSAETELFEDQNGSIGMKDTEFERTEPPSISVDTADSSGFGEEDAVNYISAVFLKNNVSASFAKDIFEVAKVIHLYPSIQISDIFKKIAFWGNHDTHFYSFCVSCDKIMSKSQKCLNRKCNRYLISQSNISGNKTILNFSIRKQLEQLIDNGLLDLSILNDEPESLCSRVRNTPKYRKKVNKYKFERPDVITLMMSMNTDGFRKRGCKRGEFWPVFLAIHDVCKGGGMFREYRAEFVVLSAMLQSSTKLTHHDFSSMFERMYLEIEEIKNRPLKVTIGEDSYEVIVEMYESVLDMDASRKIHGIPVWQAYDSCSRCTVSGTPTKMKKRSIISWIPDGDTEMYNDSNLPPKLLKTCLLPPWEDGFDALHLISEGTSKDLLKDVLGNGRKSNRKLNEIEKKSWSEALSSTLQARGMCTATLLDPIQLSSRTGSEIEQIYRISIPTLSINLTSFDNWHLMITLHWLTTRVITDRHLCVNQCEMLRPVVSYFREIIGIRFPVLYTMKFHFVFDHLVPNLHLNGSPLLTSAAPFERLNQILGRSLNTYTTRATLNMATRFLGIQQASATCFSAVQKKGCPVQFPVTMQSEKEIHDYTIAPRKLSEDNIPLTTEEQGYLLSEGIFMRKKISNTKIKGYTYSARRTSSSMTSSSNVYYFDEKKHIKFGSIERIYNNDNGDVYILMQEFEVIDPFKHIYEKCLQDGQLVDPNTFGKLVPLFEKLNSYYLKITGCHYTTLNSKYLEGYCDILEYCGQSFLSRC